MVMLGYILIFIFINGQCWYFYWLGGIGFIAIIGCLLYTSDAADELDGVDLGGRRIIKKKK